MVEITDGFIVTFLVMKTTKWFERYYKMALCREAKLYHNQMKSSESAKHGDLYEVKFSLIISLEPEFCTRKTPNTQ